MKQIVYMEMLNALEHPILNEMLHDGRRIRIMGNYFYEYTGWWSGDPTPKRYEIHKGDIVNGADKPKILWSFSGGPYIGKERIASFFHDPQCDQRINPHKEVHNMFWFMMMDLGVEEGRADRRWKGVDLFGPRWDLHGHDEERSKEDKALMGDIEVEW